MHQVLQHKQHHHNTTHRHSDSSHVGAEQHSSQDGEASEREHGGQQPPGSAVTTGLLSSLVNPAQILLKTGHEEPGATAETTLTTTTTSPWDPGSYREATTGKLPEKPCLRLNISGTCYQILRSNLTRFPSTRLGKLALAKSDREAQHLCDTLIYANHEFYFDRSPMAFDAIATFYRQEHLHFPDNVCPYSFFEEINYWEIDRKFIAPCCELKLHLAEMEEKRILSLNSEGEKLLNHLPGMPVVNGKAEYGFFRPPTTKRKFLSRPYLWDILEHPVSSKLALLFTLISVGFVMATVIILILGSMPEFRQQEVENMTKTSNGTTDSSQTRNSVDVVDSGLEIADAVCVIWFTMEILLRVWAAPDRCLYLRSPLSLIDIGAVVPFYVELAMQHTGTRSQVFENVRKSLLMIRILRALRVMRVLRVLKVARYSRGFQSVGATLRKSWKELLMLVMFMFTTNIIFSTVIYFIEGDEYEGSKFTSIPAASWWCIITMTTVGYGDVFPHTVGGKLVAVVVSISGIILLAFPISVIVEHFHEEYTGENGEGKEEEIPDDPKTTGHLALALVRANASLAQMVAKSLVASSAEGSQQLDLDSSIFNAAAGQKKKRRARRGFKL